MDTTRSLWPVPAPWMPQAPEVLEVMVFALGEKEYGIDLQKVRELRSYDVVTRIANAPDFIRGTIDLRGRTVPLVDMGIALGTPASDEFSDIIVLNTGGRLSGMVVDAVLDVVTLTAGQISPPSAAGAPLHANCLIGIGAVDDRTLILIDIDNLMSSDEMAILGKLTA